ncbi:signal peptidase I [Oligoflexus tunisiensis]|uniref:signal peptidase I n=1 Tax=Oligoflexus tunisiensis TaxID=708132 RepID=UPI00159F2017|nr:signal peptidase I [Oligoflexus tunisiensis]
MPVEDLENTDVAQTSLERLRHSLVVLILLDLITLGLYSAARCYPIHAELSQRCGRRLFSLGFLHILIMLNLVLWVLRFSRDNRPLDAPAIMTRLGAALLFISMLLIFRRLLQEKFQLRILPAPLAVLGFWYLQHRINRAQTASNPIPYRDFWFTPMLVVATYVALSFTLGATKIYYVANASMEPTLVPGDYVIMDQFSDLFLDPPQRGDLVIYQAPQNQQNVQVKRVLGLPGDRLSFREDGIRLNDKPLSCSSLGVRKPKAETVDHKPKRLFECQVDHNPFVLQRYQEGPLTAIYGDFEVPSQHYFVVGDNLHNSSDSRVIGAIPATHIVGRVRMIIFSYRAGESVPWSRWFQPL